MDQNISFPKELNFFKYFCWLSVIGLAISVPLYILFVFGDISGQKKILVLISLITSVLSSFMSLWIIRILKKRDSDIPGRIIKILFFVVVIIAGAGLLKIVFMSMTNYPQFYEALRKILINLIIYILAYNIFAAQFRYLTSVKNYYGANAELSKLKFFRFFEEYLNNLYVRK